MQNVNWWKALNWAWLMAAAANLVWTLAPQLLLLLFPNSDWKGDNTSSALPLSSLTHRPFPRARRLEMRDEAKRMFYWGYDNYMLHAFPFDELNPINCSGRGHDWDNLSNTNINDVLGDYSLTLVDTLDTLAVMGDRTEFMRAVQLVVDNVSFDRCTTVQVFEATIRVMGALLSAHLLIKDPLEPFGPLSPPDYGGELLELAHNLAGRLLPAFDNSSTGLPYPRVNLCYGLPSDGIHETCTAGAGTLTLEFSLLSRLLGDPVYEGVARRAVQALWERRHRVTGLAGNVIDVTTGQWTGRMSGLGAGIDSYYEYLLKSYVLFGEREDLEMFMELYRSIMKYLRKGRSCHDAFVKSSNLGAPFFVNVDYATGRAANYWLDSLSSSFAAVQVLAGDLEEAICTHALYYSIWRKYEAMPERFDWNQKSPNVRFYPLRPELVESTYLLYQATHNPFYLHVGSHILESLERHARTECGYATLHDVLKKTHEDRMESFFLSETCKYLYLGPRVESVVLPTHITGNAMVESATSALQRQLFDTDNEVNRHGNQYLFTTEGHLFRINPSLRVRPWAGQGGRGEDDASCAVARTNESAFAHSCSVFAESRRYSLPLSREELGHIESLVGGLPP